MKEAGDVCVGVTLSLQRARHYFISDMCKCNGVIKMKRPLCKYNENDE